MYRILSLLLVMVFLVMADTGQTSEKWALIIGVDKFDDPSFGNLKYTVNDANILYQTLISIPNGFPRDNMMLITPTRVGFMPTPSSSIREPGTTLAATRKNAAEEKSPGIVRSEPYNVPPGRSTVWPA